MVEHVHDHNDASFGHWSMKLPKEDFPTIPLLMKLYMDLDIVPIIPHLIEEVPDFIKPFILKGGNHLVGHSKPQQFHFYVHDNAIPAMQFQILCTSPNLSPEDGLLVWRQDEYGKYVLLDGEPKPYMSNPMRNGLQTI